MATTVKCRQCGEEIEISAALQGQIEEQVLKAEHEKHAAELARVRAETAEQAKKESDAALQMAQKQLAGEIELAKKEAQADLELERKKLEAELTAVQKKTAAEQELAMKHLQDEAAAEKAANKELREKLTELMQELRAERKAKENAELTMQKKLVEEEGKIREAAAKEADEKQRLNLAARDKTIADLQKALDEAQRKAAQGSQQLQGEVMELDFEAALADAFRDDDIEPVGKGIKGGDIRQVVKSSKGLVCGVMLWEIKRTKNWTEGWIMKLKDDLRAEKANVPIIISEVLPRHLLGELGVVNGVWVCKPGLALPLGMLLRKNLLDVHREKAIAENRGTKAEALYNFVTSHEFAQQIESMVETFRDMNNQIMKERVAFEKSWALREKQAQKLLLSTANIVGGMQGHIGHGSMPKIKGLELLEAGEDDTDEPSQATLL
ncbi:MAG TPA: DUF2130 domain-containing protein [Candidatus Saccharimonadales bacterium]|nr:DUF2130 domain-containing protein [Candidatus Saccharimonadales bacterium]